MTTTVTQNQRTSPPAKVWYGSYRSPYSSPTSSNFSQKSSSTSSSSSSSSSGGVDFSSCQRSAPRENVIQSPTISNSDRINFKTKAGTRKIEKGERERKRVKDIRLHVEKLRNRIDPQFLDATGCNSKKPNRLQTLKNAVCYICSLSQVAYGDRWTCRCNTVGMAHKQINLKCSRPSNASRSRVQPYDTPRHSTGSFYLPLQNYC